VAAPEVSLDTNRRRVKQPEPLRPGRAGYGRWRWIVAVVVIACGIGLFVAYLRQARTIGVGLPERGADGASQAVQAWDMLHGNWLLRGWSLTDVSFYTTELPQYGLVEFARGLSTDVVHVVAALNYALMVLLAGWLAKGTATGREGVIRALVAAGIMLAPPLGPLRVSTTFVVLSYPDHTGTQVPLLLTWLVLDRGPRRWWMPVVITALLGWVQVADTMALYEGALPLVAVCLVRVIRQWLRQRSWAGYEFMLAVGGIASAAGATFVLKLIRHVGGFAMSPPGTALSTAHSFVANLLPKLRSVLIVFGADFTGQPASRAVIPLVHLAGLALVACAVGYAVVRFFAEDDLLVQVVTASLVVVLAAYTAGFRVGAWEAVGLLPTGAVLAGRWLARMLVRTRLVVLWGAVLACYAAFLAFDATTSTPIGSPSARVIAVLDAHHLTSGLAPYWQASSITVQTDDRVQVRPIMTDHGAIAVNRWNINANWYNPRKYDAHFVIWSADGGPSLLTWYRVEGQPENIYRAGGYVVLVWDKNLLTAPIKLGPPFSWNIVS
jgi:hypothetical protein